MLELMHVCLLTIAYTSSGLPKCGDSESSGSEPHLAMFMRQPVASRPEGQGTGVSAEFARLDGRGNLAPNWLSTPLKF
jgi:hypothetical protein